jgi:hypothetical protein
MTVIISDLTYKLIDSEDQNIFSIVKVETYHYTEANDRIANPPHGIVPQLHAGPVGFWH